MPPSAIPCQWTAAYTKVRTIVSTVLRIPEDHVHPLKDLHDDLGADSVAMIDLALALEDEFGAEITSQVAESMHTVNDLINWAAEHQA